MFHVHFIWAQSTSGIIGVNGKLPWHDRGDLQHFKDMTTGENSRNGPEDPTIPAAAQ